MFGFAAVFFSKALEVYNQLGEMGFLAQYSKNKNKNHNI
jgi:hypothetical protein